MFKEIQDQSSGGAAFPFTHPAKTAQSAAPTALVLRTLKKIRLRHPSEAPSSYFASARCWSICATRNAEPQYSDSRSVGMDD